MKILWLEPAIIHMDTIFTFNSDNSIESATDIYNDILERTDILLTFPFAAAIEPILKDLSKVYRSLVVRKNYKVVYFVESDVIYISAVFDCRQNPEKLKQIIKR